MGGRFETEFDRDELISLVRELRRELQMAHERIASLEQRVEELSKRSPTTRLDESYSLKAEERRREKHTTGNAVRSHRGVGGGRRRKSSTGRSGPR